MIYGLIVCLIIIGFLGYKLFQKQQIDRTNLEMYKADLEAAKEDFKNQEIALEKTNQELKELNSTIKNAKEKREYEEYKLEECKKDLQAAMDVYQDLTDNKLKEIDASIEEQRQKRQEELDRIFEEKKAHYDTLLKEALLECGKQTEEALEFTNNKLKEYSEANELFDKRIEECKTQFESIERVLRQYEAEQQEKLFYTIQLPEEYREDIEFLLTTVAAKVQHKDIISKLVWAEYVKPNLDDTFKRIEIKAEPGIYKLTSLANGKCYIGKSTNVKTRISDHFKSAIGIKSIAHQAVHHAILKEGFWNWQIEIITYCDKEQLSELEKYYIEFFKAQTWGYNRNQGG